MNYTDQITARLANWMRRPDARRLADRITQSDWMSRGNVVEAVVAAAKAGHRLGVDEAADAAHTHAVSQTLKGGA